MEHILHEEIIPFLQRRFDLRELIKVRILHCAGIGEGTIDEKIGDLEQLANPTVGLAAHTGVVDVRIAAKAQTEEQAARLIAAVEEQIRARLGKVVFGADDDRLEQIAEAAVSQRGWSLVGVEYGGGGELAGKLTHIVSVPRAASVELLEATQAARATAGADAALGLAVDPGSRTAEMVLITPRTVKSHRIFYGGPPRSLSRWAANLALNWLRISMDPEV
jgi:nicotinamide-nucleotide amidase